MITMGHLSAALRRSNDLRQSAEREEQARLAAQLAAKRTRQAEQEAAWQAELKARRQQEDPAWLAEKEQKQEAEDAAWQAELEKLAKEMNDE